MTTQRFESFDVDKKLAQLSTATKVRLLGGKDFWCLAESLPDGIPSVRVSDGPNGVRGRNFFGGTPSSCLPCGTGLAASFDSDLLLRVGRALGDECRAKSAHVLLGPTVNLPRSPLGGRGFEAYSEDPLLSGHLAASYIIGVQEKGVSACLKHFVGNEQEYKRHSVDSVMSERTLREVYLEPFRLAVKLAQPKSLMTAYGRLNGTHCSENRELLEGILRGEWGWEGMIMSDWKGVYSTAPSIQAGLDLEMPGKPVMRGATVSRALGAGTLTLADVDDRVRNILGVVNHAIESGIPFYQGESAVDTPEVRSLLREAAINATVLLKNDLQLLPLDASFSGKKLAIVGLNAKVAVSSGGGSASLKSTYLVSMLEALTAAAAKVGATTEYCIGAAAYRYVPLIDPYLTHPSGAKNGAVIDFFNGPADPSWYTPSAAVPAEPAFTVDTDSASCFMIDNVPYDKLDKHVRIQVRSVFTPDVSGEWSFGVVSVGFSQLFLNGEPIVENVESFQRGDLFFTMGSQEQRGTAVVEAGQQYELVLRSYVDPTTFGASPYTYSCSFRIGAFPVTSSETARAEAVQLATSSDVAVVVVGTNPDFESEGFDRHDMRLPGDTDALVEAVLAANPHTIVVNQSGTPVEMPWLDRAPTVIHTFFGGNELGNGLADVVFGAANPSGKLPLTFPKRLQDTASFHSFSQRSETPGKVLYNEGIFVGYRHHDYASLPPAFPFGFGLSYTAFSFSDLVLAPLSPEGDLTVSFVVTNTGARAGAEVAQLYVAAPSTAEADEPGDERPAAPVKELRGFAKTAVLEPGAAEAVKIELDRRAFSYWDERVGKWRMRTGRYALTVATSSAVGDVRLGGDVVVKKEVRWQGL
ncbi:hypothetical protein JCM10207_001762 [Rhodosporidiobolus poonsookiae]